MYSSSSSSILYRHLMFTIIYYSVKRKDYTFPELAVTQFYIEKINLMLNCIIERNSNNEFDYD